MVEWSNSAAAAAIHSNAIGLTPWSPPVSGLLAGVLKKEQKGSRRTTGRAKAALKTNRKAITAYEKFCADLGPEPADVGLAWLLHQPVVTAPIVGPRTMDQFEGALRALDVRLDDDAIDRLDEIFPGYETAPEDYAW